MDEKEKKIIKGQLCPYCNCETKLVTGELVYPNWSKENPRPNFLDKKYYMCILNSDHYVGTYSDNITSLGRVADKELRKLKNQGHRIFDPLWKNKTHFKNQRDAYLWLSKMMNLPLKLTHFGMFSIEQCNQAIDFCNNILKTRDNEKTV